MDIKKQKSFLRRIKRAQSTLNCMGDMILTFEIDAMSTDDMRVLRAFLASKSVSYKYLDDRANRVL